MEPEPVDSLEESFGGSVSQSSETFGFVKVNIVRLRDYSATFSGQETAVLVREPLTHDQNAIKVLDTRTLEVGYIERSAAKVLAPLIDSKLITVEGIIVPISSRRRKGSKIPVHIRIFAKRDAFATVQSEISLGRLQLIDDSCFLSKVGVVQEARTLDAIFKLVYENVSKRSTVEALEPPKDVIKSELFLHQKEGLGWLIQRENSCELPPFWEEKDGVYVNVLMKCQTNIRPEPLRGGIFADDMGLGKTLTLLSLIAFDAAVPSSISSERVNTEQSEAIDEEDKLLVLGTKKAKRRRENENDCNSQKKRKTNKYTHFDKMVKGKSAVQLDRDMDASSFKPTLIVCPSSVLSTWVTQLEEHTSPGRLKLYLYYGTKRTQDAEELQKHDIVLTTYGTLAWSNTPVKKIEWWRIILDEAHEIKNVNAERSCVVTNLNSKRWWVVTGTPIQNGSSDLFPLMVFLRLKPFSIESYWNSLVQRPLAEGNEEGLLRLQTLMASISLRRTKDKVSIGLPPKTIKTCFVELSAEQRELYDQTENEAKAVVWNYIHGVTSNYFAVLTIILRLRQICTDVALFPKDQELFLPVLDIKDVSKNPELLRKMVSQLKDGEDLECPICISPPSDIVISCCGHIFCQCCILKCLKLNRSCCPLCRHKLSVSDLFSSLPESSDTNKTKVSCSSVSPKMSALLKLLAESKVKDPAKKSVVFSQFPKMLIMLEKQLKAAGFKILRLDVSMNATRRARVIQAFELPAPDGPTVLLASLRASCAGINLIAASTVYLFEPWWNPAVEDQAMDRVHRLGQKEDVEIVRIISQNSIEERMLQLQEKKRTLAREAFGRKGKDRRGVSIDDFRTLMSL